MEEVNLAGATPMEEQTTEPAAEDVAAAPPPEDAAAETEAAEQQNTEDTETPDEPAGEAPFLSVQFNHENRDMTREQAVEFAQKGLMYEKISPIYHKLDYLAAQQSTNVGALVDALVSAAEDAYKQSLTEKFGDDAQLVEDLMALYHSRNQEKYNKLLADREKTAAKAAQEARAQREHRLTGQFMALQKECPEIKNVSDLPKEVVRLAAEGKNDLTAAYLLHKHRQEQKIAAATAKAAAQSKQSTGSVQSAENTEAAAVDAFIRGVRTMK